MNCQSTSQVFQCEPYPKISLIRAEWLHKDKTVNGPKSKNKRAFNGIVPADRVTVSHPPEKKVQAWA